MSLLYHLSRPSEGAFRSDGSNQSYINKNQDRPNNPDFSIISWLAFAYELRTSNANFTKNDMQNIKEVLISY